ncbi:MAG: hypothetical protein J6386_21370 [Candidatus Synoicihabitans palmerolidicus]|nr:hypothetical protein [Candidatus Synoicihabitans palmerolidicus]
MLKIALGLARPDRGSCRVAGCEAGGAAARRMAGYMPELGGVQLHLTGKEGLVWLGRLNGMPKPERRSCWTRSISGRQNEIGGLALTRRG